MPRKIKESTKTEFSRKIREYITLSGNSVYKVAQITELGRTAIQHTMTGTLIPTMAFFEKLCTALRITPQQKYELTEMYMKAKFGDEAYDDMKNIHDIIENLPQYCLRGNHKTVFPPVQISDDTVITGIVNVNQAIITMIENELSKDNPHISVTIPFEDVQLFNNLVQLQRIGEKKIVFEHYFRIYKTNVGISGGNIEILKSALKMSMNTGIMYKPYYYYAFKESQDDSLPIYPYCVVTSDYVGMVSEDFKSIFFSRKTSLLKAAHSHTDKLKRKSDIMIEAMSYMQTIDIAIGYSGIYSKSLEFEPCITRYLTGEIIQKRIKDFPEKEIILETVGKAFFTSPQIAKTKSHKYSQVFDRRGIEDFALTGEIKGLCGDLLNPLSPKERIDILEAIKNDVGVRCKMLDSGKLAVPEYLQLVYLSNHNCVIAYRAEDKQFCCILTEQGICSSIENYIKSLTETDCCVDDIEILEVIDKCIENLKSEYNVE